MPEEPTTQIVPSDSAHAVPDLPPPMDGVEPSPIKLNSEQEKALEMIISGKSSREVMQELKVSRSTFWRWRTYNANFVAALNQWRGQVQAEIRDRVLETGLAAADTVGESVVGGDARLSFQVLEKMGMLKPGPDAPVDAYFVFGDGSMSQAERKASFEGYRRARRCMTRDQLNRSPQLLALGVIAENQRTGRVSSRDLLELAGLAVDAPMVSSPALPDVPERAPEVGETKVKGAKIEVSRPDSLGAGTRQSPLQVKARVLVSSPRRNAR